MKRIAMAMLAITIICACAPSARAETEEAKKRRRMGFVSTMGRSDKAPGQTATSGAVTDVDAKLKSAEVQPIPMTAPNEDPVATRKVSKEGMARLQQSLVELRASAGQSKKDKDSK